MFSGDNKPLLVCTVKFIKISRVMVRLFFFLAMNGLFYLYLVMMGRSPWVSPNSTGNGKNTVQFNATNLKYFS